MKTWKILSSNNSNEWRDMVESCEQPDLHFLPEYLKIYEDKIGGSALLFVSYDQDNENFVLYPFFLRDIKKVKVYSKINEICNDIISPWYYGGPLVKNNNNKTKSLKKFLDDFQVFVKKKNIISEFTRIHPILDAKNEFSSMVNATSQDYISFIDLKQDLEIIWKNFKKSNKNAINFAKRKGVKIKFSKSEESISIFSNFYDITMKNLNSDKWYLFSLDFFKNLTDSFKEDFIIAKAIHGKKVIAISLFFYKYGISYYWLSGYDYTKRNLYPNNLLLLETIKWLKKEGNHCFILGGGNENLNKFKQSFTNTTLHKFHLNKIHNPRVYKKLMKIHNKNNLKKDEGFFPEYRYE